jgi:hypothetical protein
MRNKEMYQAKQSGSRNFVKFPGIEEVSGIHRNAEDALSCTLASGQ